MFIKGALARMEEHIGESHEYTVRLYQDLAKLLLAMGRRGDALALFEKPAKMFGDFEG